MLQHRLATLQAARIGYPPTGLNTVDGKLMDPYINDTVCTSRYYAEAPVVLKNSFWCFDPLLEDIPVIGDIVR